MKQPHLSLVALGLGVALALPALAADDGKIVIAHRGASGYLPEHTLESKALAYGMGADYLEQDLVMTRDDQLVVMHDHFLDGITDVPSVSPVVPARTAVIMWWISPWTRCAPCA